MSDIRRDIRDRIEAQQLFGQPTFKVWINEDAGAAGLDDNSWEACIAQVVRADIVLVLNTGHGGWRRSDAPGDIGICHAELMTARNAAPGKVRLIPLRGAAAQVGEDDEANIRFQAYVDTLNPFSRAASTEAELIEYVDRAMSDAVVGLAHLGVREARKGKFYSGDALVWSKLDFETRSSRMVETVVAALSQGAGDPVGRNGIVRTIGGARVLMRVHAAPAGLSLAPSRERVGRPFLRDHLELAELGDGVVGPLHLVASQSGATEAQGRALLGLPDATVVTAPFGVFVADEVQQVQLALLKDCRDATTTRSAANRFFDWVREAGEADTLARRARGRRQILEVVRLVADG